MCFQDTPQGRRATCRVLEDYDMNGVSSTGAEYEGACELKAIRVRVSNCQWEAIGSAC